MKIYVQAANQISLQQPLCETWMDSPIVPEEPYTRSIDPDFKEYVSPVEGRRMGKLMKRALATSLKTLGDSGLECPEAILTGTGLGCVESTEAFLLDMCQNGEQLLKPTHFMQSTHNTIGSLVAIQTKCHGYNATYSHRLISFESALYDAQLQLMAGELNNALVLGQDATTPNYFHLLELAGYVGNGMTTTCGEASVATLLTPEPLSGKTPLCELAGVKLLYHYTPEEVAKALKQMEVPTEDLLVLAGYNGQTDNDEMYDQLLSQTLPQVPVLKYKQWFGECFSASALGFYAAAHRIAKGWNKNILVVTLDKTGEAALTLLKSL